MPPRTTGRRAWEHLSDEELLEVRIRDLDLRLEGSDLPQRIAQLHEELGERGILLRPPGYLADEWFTPTGEWSIGIPFYLAHPRLKALEKRMMLEVEGGTRSWCMRLLRHEAGHAVDHAYRLHAREDWREIFGSPRLTYRPEVYVADPRSTHHVRSLPSFYAQAHPIEDFAETFAVWLNPASHWRARYAGWPALRKLRYVDRVMREVAGRAPPRRRPRRLHELKTLRATLRTYYERKFRLYELHDLSFALPAVRTLFRRSRSSSPRNSAAALIAAHRRTLVDSIVHWSGERRSAVTSVVDGLYRLCDENALVLRESPETSLLRVSVLATTLVLHRLHAHTYRLPAIGLGRK